MIPYWWRLALEGTHAQARFVRKHPRHWGLGKLRQESMEGWIGLVKMYLRKSGNHKRGWLLRVAHYLDLYCVGAIICNMVDFYKIETKHYLYQKLIYDGLDTDLYQLYLEETLDDKCKRILNLIKSIKFGDEISKELSLILCNLTEEEYNRLQNATRVMDNGEDNFTMVDENDAVDQHGYIMSSRPITPAMSQMEIFNQLQKKYKQSQKQSKKQKK